VIVIDGILIINKPKGITSFDVVAAVRNIFGEKKVGHCGTLDPLATGVLPVLIGKATKALDFIPESQKEYIANFRLGIETDTQDITGKILNIIEKKFKKPQIIQVLDEFLGSSLQVPPMYSALKKNGKKLYELAREGKKVERAARKVHIDKIELLEFFEENLEGRLFVSCSKGTYIRTICHDLGQKLGSCAVLTDLVRVKTCGFDLETSVSLQKIEKNSKSAHEFVLPIDSLFTGYKKIFVSEAQAKRFRNGGALGLERLRMPPQFDGDIFCVYSPEKVLLGLAEVAREKAELKALKILS
jgi:tRNA pseudouridine55 synthase